MSPAQPDLLAVVEQSPLAAGAHDRTAWVGLFTNDGQVEDPVGSRPHVGWTQIGRFYDTFIGPRDITFHRGLDIVRGSTVVRDLELEVAMGTAVTMHIPAVLRYDLRQVDDQWKLARLRAYWDLPAMMWAFSQNGRAAVPAGAELARALLTNQGLRGSAGFVAGFRRPGVRAKNTVRTFVAALAHADLSAASRRLTASAEVGYGDNDSTDLADLGRQLAGARSTRMLGAGSTVAVSIGSDRRCGVLFADVARRGTLITRVRYFPA